MSKPLKSSATGETSVWLAHPPKFLEAEGAFTAYKAGKSVDAWLVNPTDKKAKINFLKKLASRERLVQHRFCKFVAAGLRGYAGRSDEGA
jgi:hypothetical protein